MSSAPIATGQPSGNNHQWRSPRQRIETLMYVDLGPENGGFPINVSEGGMAFQGIRPLEKDQLILINFKLPGLTDSLESLAQIAWLNDLGKGGGLRFIELPDCTRRLIIEWLSLQNPSCDLPENSPIECTLVETENFQPAPAIHSVTNQDRSSAEADSGAVKTPLDPSPSPVGVASAITTSGTMPIPVRSVNSERDSGFRDPLLETNRRKTWSMPVWVGLISSLAIVAILSAISFQFHWSLQFPTMGGNPAASVNQSDVATAPAPSPEMRAVDPPPPNPTDSESTSTAPRPAIDAIAPLAEPATLGPRASVSRPAKRALPQIISPPKPSIQKMRPSAGRLKPRLKVASPAGDITPPTLPPPTNPALASQLPALLLGMPLHASAPRMPLQQTSKFESAQLIAGKNPVYPKVAQAIRLSGSVELHFIIGADGHVRDMTVVRGNPLLAHAVVEAIQTWLYQPARRDGIPVETESSTVFAFKPN
jgi:TonB family protein